MNLSKEINDKHIFGISKLLSFMLFATKTAVLKRSTLHQTVPTITILKLLDGATIYCQ